MSKFPVDAPKAKVIKTPESLGFRLVRQQEHIAMVRQDPDGSRCVSPASDRHCCSGLQSLR